MILRKHMFLLNIQLMACTAGQQFLCVKGFNLSNAEATSTEFLIIFGSSLPPHHTFKWNGTKNFNGRWCWHMRHSN